MALNVWKSAGKPTSYSPLPTGTVNKMYLYAGTYTLRVKAKSDLSGILTLDINSTSSNNFTNIDTGVAKQRIYIPLSPTWKTYVINFSLRGEDTFYLWDRDVSGTTVGDIMLEGIELVRKSAPSPTINGIDGFTASKWVLHTNAKVIDDETMVLASTATGQSSYLDIPVYPNTKYTLSRGDVGNNGVRYEAYFLDANMADLGGYVNVSGTTPSVTFTTPGGTRIIRLYATNNATGQVTYKRPMLNIGATVLPYSRKTGERMVQASRLPARKIPSKNFFDGVLESGAYSASDGSLVLNAAMVRSKNLIPVKPGLKHTISKVRYLHYYSINGTYLNSSGLLDETVPYTFTPASNCYYVRFHFSGSDLSAQVQVEEGVVSTRYTPYQLTIPKPRVGFPRMDGIYNYASLPSITLDAIEIDCLIDSTQYIPDAVIFQSGSSTAFGRVNGENGGSITSRTINGAASSGDIPRNVRQKIKYTFSGAQTAVVTLMANGSLFKNARGILYKITCYSAGQVVAQYDFNNAVKNYVVGKQEWSLRAPKRTIEAKR